MMTLFFFLQPTYVQVIRDMVVDPEALEVLALTDPVRLQKNKL